MGKKKKNKNRLKTNSQTQINDYDLKNSLAKLNQKDVPFNSSTGTNFQLNESKSNEINSDMLAKNASGETNLLLSLNDKFSNKYDGLNDKIMTSTNTVRLELEGKIDKKVSDKIFYGACAVLVVIGSIIYALSYSDVIIKSNQGAQSALENKQIINNMDDKVKSLETRLNKQGKQIHKLEVEKKSSVQNSDAN